ncbi:MAG: DUF3343 domain-containing protein [Tissierellia bacterium]|nr:DUF3343 domain-containing protein [Tissierellia bacterium]
MNYIITFHTVSEVLRFETMLKREQIKVKLMPVPRQFSSSCGLCGKVAEEDLERIKELAASENVEFDQIYEFGDK